MNRLAALLSWLVVAGAVAAAPVTETMPDGVRVYLDVPAAADPPRPTLLVVYATPNGNTIEQTLGGRAAEGQPPLDWHYDIQHIAAQVRLLREVNRRERIALAVIEAPGRSWPAFCRARADAGRGARELVETIGNRVRGGARLALVAHSGGGSFLFAYLDGGEAIPAAVATVAFLDANYGYADAAHHGEKLIAWLRGDADRRLFVLAYDDREITLDGKPVVGPEGGTYRATDRMLARLRADAGPVTTTTRGPFDAFAAAGGQARLFRHPNPQNKILHTALVGEMNGLLAALTTGRPEEDAWGTFGGPRAYAAQVQVIAAPTTKAVGASPHIPARRPDAAGGAVFVRRLATMPAAERDAAIVAELLAGNVPAFERAFKPIRLTAAGPAGAAHVAEARVCPDYLAVGSDEDFVRLPMTPAAARRVADAFGCTLPTRRLVDEVYRQADEKLAPIPMDRDRESPLTFVRHQELIEAARGGHTLGALVAGVKKDVVLSNRLRERPDRVAIYGWHQLDGRPIQPLTIVHAAAYVDYSHGVRLVARDMVVDGRPLAVEAVLADPELCTLLSDEGPMDAAALYVAPGAR